MSMSHGGYMGMKNAKHMYHESYMMNGLPLHFCHRNDNALTEQDGVRRLCFL